MLIELTLLDFRNYKRKEFFFDKLLFWIDGPNGSGKTNLLESIYLLATGKSKRVRKHEELIRWGADVASVRGKISSDSGDSRDVDLLEINITRGEVHGQKTQAKKYTVNGVNRQQRKFVGRLPAVWFGPEDLDIVLGSGSKRRDFWDDALSQIDSEYARAIGDYEKALRRRNKLLDLLKEGRVNRSAFGYFDQVLINAGSYIQKCRYIMVEVLNNWLVNDDFGGNFRLIYDWSEMSRGRLDKYTQEEIASGSTLVGPHRDDLIIEYDFGSDNWQRLDRFGSRGQQRMGALALKISELEFVANKIGNRPILLLDDVFSELDLGHRRVVIELMEKQQTIGTGVGEFESYNIDK